MAPADEPGYGMFERVDEASGSFDAAAAAFESALRASRFVLQGTMDMDLGPKEQRGRVYVLTSPEYEAAAAGESPDTISAQILRVAIYEYGKGRAVQIDMANPVAHAMVFYAGSRNYGRLIAAAKAAAQELRDVAAKVPGKPVSVQIAPMRTEATLNEFDGDGPAKMMARWRNWRESQGEIFSAPSGDFARTVAKVEATLRNSKDAGAGDPSGWRLIAKVPVGAHAVYFGVSNAYTENKCVRIDSEFRSDGKTGDAPLPGIDHSPALPLEVLVVDDGDKTRVLQYGEMWRMQLYFWDAGYAAFTTNVGVPGNLSFSIEKTLSPQL